MMKEGAVGQDPPYTIAFDSTPCIEHCEYRYTYTNPATLYVKPHFQNHPPKNKKNRASIEKTNQIQYNTPAFSKTKSVKAPHEKP